MLDDQQLLRRYVADGSEAAFGELVARYVNLVYSAALRRTGGDAHLAQDAAQLVFTDLARKARSLPREVVLAGWLHRATQFAAAQLLRTERRRAVREQEAVAMNALTPETTLDWNQIRPLLDQALDELGDADRDALILRFFEQRSLAEVGTAIGSNEDAARKRVTRALEKLRADLVRRGITTTAATLSAAISVNAVQAAPVGLAATLSTTAIAGTTFTAGAATATKTIAMSTIQKTVIAAALTVAVGAGIYEARRASTLRNQVQTLQQQQTPLTGQIQQLQRERDDGLGKLAALKIENERLSTNASELPKLRGEVSLLRRRLAETDSPKFEPTPQDTPASQPADALEQQKRMAAGKGFDGGAYAVQLITFAMENDGWFPTNWQDVARYVKDYPASGTNHFEMVYHPPLKQDDLGTNVSRTALVREYLAWPTFDGKWGKVYGFADGHSDTIILSDGNFAGWEEEHTFKPAPPSK